MPPIWAAFLHDRDYKPGSVIDSHLSRRIVADTLQPPSRKQPGRPCFLCGVAPDRVYSNGRFRTPLGALLPHLSTLTTCVAVSFSMALSLGSLPPDVIRHPALRSSDFPHALRPAIIFPARVLQYSMETEFFQEKD